MSCRGQIIINAKASIKGVYRIEGESLNNLLLWEPRAGEAFTVIDAEGGLYRARAIELGTLSASLLVFEDMGRASKTTLEITLLQALPDRERMELIIQKTTELGVSAIVPFKSRRSISLEERESRQKKAHAWSSIALKAAKQCRRTTIPEVLPYGHFSEALIEAKDAQLKIALWEKSGGLRLKDALNEAKGKGVKKAAILSGPEGGFDDDEIEEAKGAGFIPVSLGQRILRAETAPIIAVGIIQHELGD